MDELMLMCGVIAGPFFMAVILIEGVIRKDYYPMRQPGSTLARGPRGWIQKANFLITGALILVYAFGLPSALRPYGGSLWLPIVVGLIGLGLIGAGMFVTDVTGLPEDRAKLAHRTTSGTIHDRFGLPTFAGLFIASFISAYLFVGAMQWSWVIYCSISGIVLAPCVVLAGAGFSGAPRLEKYGGLFQRIAICAGFMCLSLVAFHLR